VADEHDSSTKPDTDEQATTSDELQIDVQATTETDPHDEAAPVDISTPAGVALTPSDTNAQVVLAPDNPSGAVAAPVPAGRGPLPSRGTIAGANVSWEEKRKGLGPETPEDIDEQFYDERFTSERQRVDRASSRWEVVDRDNSVQNAPNWPPPLRP
jgi:hypothetical protein